MPPINTSASKTVAFLHLVDSGPGILFPFSSNSHPRIETWSDEFRMNLDGAYVRIHSVLTSTVALHPYPFILVGFEGGRWVTVLQTKHAFRSVRELFSPQWGLEPLTS
jgi:hypothetical protein